MNTLWTFGDSFTEGYGCRIEDEYYKNYWKLGDKIWPVWLGELLDVNLINCGVGGYSNDMILDSIIDNWLQIKKNDYVFIGFTYPHRFDVPIDNKLKSIVHDFKDANLKKEEIETIVNFQHYFSDNILYQDRQMKRFKWIKRLLNKYKNTGELNIHLIINHFMVLYNVFGEAATPLLFYKLNK